MKKILSMFIFLTFAAFVACGGVGSAVSNGGGLEPGASADPATPVAVDVEAAKKEAANAIKYMDYMYNPVEGEKINTAIMSAVPAELADDVQAQLDEKLAFPIPEEDETTTASSVVSWVQRNMVLGYVPELRQSKLKAVKKWCAGATKAVVATAMNPNDISGGIVGYLAKNSAMATKIVNITDDVYNYYYNGLVSGSFATNPGLSSWLGGIGIIFNGGTSNGSGATSTGTVPVDYAGHFDTYNVMVMGMLNASMDFAKKAAQQSEAEHKIITDKINTVTQKVDKVAEAVAMIDKKINELTSTVLKFWEATEYQDVNRARNYFQAFQVNYKEIISAATPPVTSKEFLSSAFFTPGDYSAHFENALVSAKKTQEVVIRDAASPLMAKDTVMTVQVEVLLQLSVKEMSGATLIGNKYWKAWYPCNIVSFDASKLESLLLIPKQDVELIKRMSLNRLSMYDKIYSSSDIVKQRAQRAAVDLQKLNEIKSGLSDVFAKVGSASNLLSISDIRPIYSVGTGSSYLIFEIDFNTDGSFVSFVQRPGSYDIVAQGTSPVEFVVPITADGLTPSVYNRIEGLRFRYFNGTTLVKTTIVPVPVEDSDIYNPANYVLGICEPGSDKFNWTGVAMTGDNCTFTVDFDTVYIPQINTELREAYQLAFKTKYRNDLVNLYSSLGEWEAILRAHIAAGNALQ